MITDKLKYSPLLTYVEYGGTTPPDGLVRPMSLRQLHSIIIGAVRPRKSRFDCPHNCQLSVCLHEFVACYAVPAGIFTYRGRHAIHCHESQITHSGLIGIQFNGVSDVMELRRALFTDSALSPSIQMLYETPDGCVLNVIVATEHRIWRRHNYVQLTNYLIANHPAWKENLEIHSSSAMWPLDIAYDPNAYLNPESNTPVPFPVKD